MLDILAKRKAVEEEAETPAPNRLSSQALSNLLDDRKAAATREEVEKLAKEYGMTMEVLEELGRHINAPSVSSIKSLDEELEDAQLVRFHFHPTFPGMSITYTPNFHRQYGLMRNPPLYIKSRNRSPGREELGERGAGPGKALRLETSKLHCDIT